MTMVIDDLAFPIPIWVESIARVERNRENTSRVVTQVAEVEILKAVTFFSLDHAMLIK